MRTGATILGLVILLLIALGLGPVTAVFAVLGIALLAGAGTLVLAFARRVSKETASRSPWADEAASSPGASAMAGDAAQPAEEAERPVTAASAKASATRRPNPAAPYVVGSIAALTVLFGVCGARLFEGGGDTFEPPASQIGSLSQPTPTVPPATPRPTPTVVVTPTAIIVPLPIIVPNDQPSVPEGEQGDGDNGDEDCPRGHRRRGRC